MRPYYGYASYVAARMHHGSRIITGELTMNFKRHGYLFSLINMIRSGKTKSTLTKPEVPTSNTQKKLEGAVSANLMALGLVLPGFAGGAAASSFVQTVTQGISSPEAAREFVRKYKEEKLLREDVINKNSHDVAKSRGAFETNKKGFDMTVSFGTRVQSSDQVLRFRADGDYYRDGQVVQDTLLSGLPGTSLKLVGVSLFSLDRAQGDDGRPLVETYSFQARDIEVLS